MQKVIIEYATDTEGLKRARQELGLVKEAENDLIAEFRKVNVQAQRQTELLEELAAKGRKSGTETKKGLEPIIGILNRLQDEYKQLEIARSRAENPASIRRLTAEMEVNRKKVADFTGEVKNSGGLLQGAFKNLLPLMAGVFAVDRVIAFASSVIKTTAETQKFKVQLTGALGSVSEASRAMVMLQEFAAKTPYSVKEMTDAYVGFANRGLRPTVEQLTNIGDVASFLQKDLSQLKEAMLDVNNTERWTELGIKVKTTGNTMVGTFRGVSVEVEKTEAGALKMVEAFGKMQGVAGTMAGVAGTIDGALSNLGDTTDRLFLSMGNRAAPAFNDMTRGLTALIGEVADLIEGENALDKVQLKTAISAKQNATEAENLLARYEQLTKGGVIPTGAAKKELDSITIRLKDTLGDSVVAINRETGALSLNKDAVREAIKQKLLLANTEASSLALRVTATDKEIENSFAAIKATREEARIRKEAADVAQAQFEKTGKFSVEFVAAADRQQKASIALLKAQMAYDEQLEKMDDKQAERARLLSELNKFGFDAVDVQKLFTGSLKETIVTESKLGLIEAKRAEVAKIRGDMEKARTLDEVKRNRALLVIAEKQLKDLEGTLEKGLDKEVGLIEKQQKRISDLQEARDKARSEKQIAYFAQRITLAEEELARLNALGDPEPLKMKINVEVDPEAQKRALQDLAVLDKALAEARASERAEGMDKEAEKWQLFIDKQYVYEVQALTDALKKGEITREQYNKRRATLDAGSQRSTLENEIRTANQILTISNLSEDERLEAEKRLIAAKKDLYDLDVDNYGEAEAKKKQILDETLRGLVTASADIANSLFDRDREIAAERLSALEADREKELQLAGDTAGAREKIEVEFAKKEAQLRKEQAEIARKQAIFNKALAIADIGMKTGQAVMSVLSTGGGTYFADFGISAGLLTALVLGLGAAQIAAVVAQPIPKYAKGTRRVKGGVEGQDSVHALLMPNEGVMPVKQNLAYDKILNAIYEERIPASMLNGLATEYEAFGRFRPGVIPAPEKAKEKQPDVTEKLLQAIADQPREVTTLTENGLERWTERRGSRQRSINKRFNLD